MSKPDLQVIVIGAGIAGLAAAWELKKAGIQTLVLEADKVVGGRMQSLQLEDALIDNGAQFLSSAYTIIPDLIKEVGLNDEFIATSEQVGLVSCKGIALINPKKPWSLLFQHVLSLWSLIRLGCNQFRLFNFKKKSLSLNDITSWVRYDKESAKDWIVKHFGKEVENEFTSSIFNGFYFQTLDQSSAAIAAAVAAFSAYYPKTMTLLSGMGSLPRTLAEKLAVKTNVTVLSVHETSTGITVTSNAGEFHAEHVIVSTPAPIAKHLIQNPDAGVLPLLGTQYSSSILISLLSDDNWLPPSEFTKVYGFLVNPHVDSKIAALTIENNKCQSRTKKGFLINVMLSDMYAKRFLSWEDEKIGEEIRNDVEKIFPTLYSHLAMKKIFRWEYAMPYTPLGRAEAVKKYRETRDEKNRIWLAGDYLGLPWTDSAAQTGLWAARRIINRIS